jgi:formylglycine-generating enzyme required for sulfatase activity
MSWKQQLIDVVFFSGLGSVLAKVLPEHWQRRANERLNDFNPFGVIAGNHDLLRAARLAWVQAALEVLDVARKTSQSGGQAFDDKNTVIRFEALARNAILRIRSEAFDRRTDPGDSPIDHHLQTIIEGTSEFIAPGKNKTQSQSLTLGFDQTLAAITGWPVRELPPMVKQMARDGLPMMNNGPNRSFAELVFAAFAEILKNPGQYPEAYPAFTIATLDAARKLSEEILAYTRGIDEKIDRSIAGVDALHVFQQGAQRYLALLPQLAAGQERMAGQLNTIESGVSEILSRMVQTAQTHPDASEAESLAEYRKLLDQLDQREFKQVLDSKPDTIAGYRAQCIARWAQPRYAIDKRFTPLTLMLDQGEDAPGERYQQQSQSFHDLRDVLNAVHAGDKPVLVVIGAPGSGKSTLLRRLELDLANQTLRLGNDAAQAAPLTVFLPMNAYGQHGVDIPDPREWVAMHWNQMTGGFLTFDALLRQPLMLLLDGLNEMPHADRADYNARLAAWKRFLEDLALNHPSVRVIFSCRTLDYGSQLTTKDLPRIPQVEITALTDPQIEEFLLLYNPNHGGSLWRQLRHTPQADLYRSPYYLKLLIDQTQDGEIPKGRAALFTGFVRAMLQREIPDNPRLCEQDWLLTERERKRADQWHDDYELPRRGKLFNALAAFAFQLQQKQQNGETDNVGNSGYSGNKSQVRIDFDDALDMLSAQVADEEQQEHLLNTAVDLQILDMPGNDVLFVHQLLQEYFAARHLAERFSAATAEESNALTSLAGSAWRVADISPTVQQELEKLPRSGTLPGLPTTGWEETFSLAAAMTADADAFVRALAKVNLPLAGRCAAQPDVIVSAELRVESQHRLVSRSRDRDADLRARILAGEALGGLGDPRFALQQGPLGRYLLPPMVAIDGGMYMIGSDEGVEDNEAPRHDVELAPFTLGQFPVTNAEFRCFIESGGYDNPRWWDTPQAQRWQRGEGTGESSRTNWRHWRDRFKNDAQFFSRFIEDQAWTEATIQQWQNYLAMTDDVFEALLKERWPDQRFVQPGRWSDSGFAAPNQPVVGVCWFEARAYCAWLSAQSGQCYRLPTEAEWEAAASGKAGCRYPWGETFDATRCNTIEARLRRVTPVGVFPESDTPPSISTSNSGIADLAGNVWEWTGSLYQPYPYRASDGREVPEGENQRVLRGGSWLHYGRYCRSADRNYNVPSSRINNAGFRFARGR